MTGTQILSKYFKRNIIILDADKKAILEISSPENRGTIKLIYKSLGRSYLGGYFNAYIESEKVEISVPRGAYDDYNLLYSAVAYVLKTSSNKVSSAVSEYIKQHPSEAGRLLTGGGYARQLKRGLALLRLDMNHPTRQMNQRECAEVDFSHIPSCIEQALNSVKSKKVSQLTKVLKTYEKSRSATTIASPEHGTAMMSLAVSRDAYKLYLTSGISVEADVYRQLVADRINNGDITTALKLCCIGHQILFCRKKINSRIPPTSDIQNIKDTFEQMLEIVSYERSKFLSICDEWYRVLEPQGLMNIEQRELLREWISTRQYANTEDPIVSLVITECSKPKKEEEEREGVARSEEDERRRTR